MKTVSTLETKFGVGVEEACADAVKTARRHDRTYNFWFNDVLLTATPDTNPSDLESRFYEENNKPKYNTGMSKSTIHPTKKLGKQAARLDRRTLQLANYLTPAAPRPPVKAGYINKVSKWPMHLNDTLGDCVIAAMAHMVEQWTAYSGNPVIITDGVVEQTYERVGGYNPGDPTTDQGCDMLTALRFWRKKGLDGHKIAAFVKVNPMNQLEMEQAVYLFGNLFAGLALPLTAQLTDSDPQVWQCPPEGPTGDGTVGSWGGHCVPIVGYSNDPKGHPGTKIITWGAPVSMTWTFLRQYCDELWAVLSPDWFTSAGEAPNGFNLAQLKADLVAITS